MFNYEIESYSLRTRKSVSHGSWVEDDEIPDYEGVQQLWRHARPNRPTVMWIQGPDDPDKVAILTVGWGDDAETLAKMTDSYAHWVSIRK